jgi:hypothetical protein
MGELGVSLTGLGFMRWSTPTILAASIWVNAFVLMVRWIIETILV